MSANSGQNGNGAKQNPGPSELEAKGLEEVEVEELEATDDDDDIEMEVLIALAELDAEAAQAYSIAALVVDDAAVRSKLEEFRDDHLRHVETLNRVLGQADGPQIASELDEGSSALTMLAASVGALGKHAALLAMIANEQLTNTTYQTASDLPFDEEIARIVERHLADEQRHLRWLTEQEIELRDRGADVGVEP